MLTERVVLHELMEHLFYLYSIRIRVEETGYGCDTFLLINKNFDN